MTATRKKNYKTNVFISAIVLIEIRCLKFISFIFFEKKKNNKMSDEAISGLFFFFKELQKNNIFYLKYELY